MESLLRKSLDLFAMSHGHCLAGHRAAAQAILESKMAGS